MSLIAWYPLNGDTKDYSGNKVDATNYGAALDNAGKIGKCYNLNGAYMTSSFNHTANNFTVCAWVYILAHSGDGNIGSVIIQDYNNNTGWIFSLVGTDSRLEIRNHYNGTSGAYNLIYGTGLSLNTWHHVAATDNGIIVNLYLNGNVVNSMSSSLATPSNTNQYIGSFFTSPTLNGKLNDVRVYDHALSLKEIKELAKAKILHYTFNDFQEPTTNYINNLHSNYNPTDLYTWASSGSTSVWSKDTTTTSPVGNSPLKEISSGTDSYSNTYAIAAYNLCPVSIGQIWTISVYAKSDAGTNLQLWFFESDVTGNYVVADAISIPATGDWQRLVFTRTITTGSFIQSRVATGHNGAVIWWDGLQIEQKDHTTPFISGSRTGIVHDISEYKNDAVLSESTTPTWTVGRLGTGGYLFPGLDKSKIYTPNNWILNSYTISFWALHTSGGKMPIGSCGASRNSNFYWYGDSSWRYVHGGAGDEFYYPKTASITPGTWGHFCVTYDGVNVKIYRNGIYEGARASSGTADFTTGFSVGYGYGSSDYDFLGNMDDVRFYATSLSPTDVLEIYQTRASLDDNGNLFLNQITSNGFKPTLIDYSTWVLGSSGSQPGFSQNGLTAENTILSKINPVGELDVVWASLSNDAGSNDDGGWNGDAFNIDKTKTYRYSLWVRKENSGNGRMYFGCDNIDDLGTTTSHPNPYFGYPIAIYDLPEAINNWVLFVAYIHENTYAGSTSSITGIYSQSGEKLSYALTDYKWSSSSTWGMLRAYQYYSTDTAERQYWYRPRVDLVDGNEPTLNQLLNCVEHRPLIDSSLNTIWNLKNINESGQGNFTQVSEVGITDGLIGWWKLNGDAKDYSGNDNHGTVIGATVTSGQKNLAYNFSGSGQYINLDNGVNFIEGRNEGTISMWFKSSADGYLFSISYGAAADYAFLYLGDATGGYSDESLSYYVYRGGATYLSTFVRNGTTIYKNNQWTHVAICTGDGNNSMYVNGVAQPITFGAGSLTTNEFSNINSQDSMRIGDMRYNGAEYGYFNGQITDTRVYNRALSAEEINILYKQGTPGTGMQISKDGTLYLNKEIIEGL